MLTAGCRSVSSSQDLSRLSSAPSPGCGRASLQLRRSPEHIYQSIGSDLGRAAAKQEPGQGDSAKTKAKAENQDSGRSVSPPPRRFFSREASVESSGGNLILCYNLFR